MGGKSPDRVYAACLTEQRVATAEQLNLMMLRSTRMQKVGRDGVRLELFGQKLYFNSHELNFYHIGRKVYVRYDPDDLAEVRVYDDRDRFLCTAQQSGALGYFEDKEKVQEAVRENRQYMKAVKTWKEQNVKKAMNELELMVWQAEQNLLEDGVRPDPKVIRIVTADGETERGLARAAGEASDTIDYTKALERIRQAKEG